MSTATLFLFVFDFLCIFGVLSLVALGGMFSERSGVINLGLEGMMTGGALGGALTLVAFQSASNVPGVLVVIIGCIVSIIVGFGLSFLLSIAAVKFKADQTLIGTAINILLSAICIVLPKAISLKTGPEFKMKSVVAFGYIDSFSIKIPISGEVLKLNWLVIVVILIALLSYYVLYKTKFGLRLRTCGENPHAADSQGINVAKMRYLGTGISGAFAGLGGFMFISFITSNWDFAVGVQGYGFLSLAVMIFGQWKPFLILLGAAVFSLFTSLSYVHSQISWLETLKMQEEVYMILPYFICLISLVATSKKSRAPKAEGIPYEKGMR